MATMYKEVKTSLYLYTSYNFFILTSFEQAIMPVQIQEEENISVIVLIDFVELLFVWEQFFFIIMREHKQTNLEVC